MPSAPRGATVNIYSGMNEKLSTPVCQLEFWRRWALGFRTQESRWVAAEMNCAAPILGGWGEVRFGEHVPSQVVGSLTGLLRSDWTQDFRKRES